MKKLVCIMLCVLMLVSCCVVPSFAAEKKNENPTILISGFLCSQLYFNYGTADETNIWKAMMKRAVDCMGDELLTVVSSLAKFAIGKDVEFGEALGDGAEYVLDLFSCNPDGSSKYELSHYPNNPETSNLDYMYKNGLEDRLYEKNFCKFLSKRADPKLIYCFQYDSRMDAITVAHQLRNFINEVKEYNNAEKVNIFALSFGGLITSTYLTLFESEKSVEKVVMSVPAIGGTNIPDRLFRGNINLPAEDLIKFFETILGGESNFARFFENDETERLNTVISAASESIRESLLCWGSIWSLCSTDLYENLKNEYLDPIENSKIINNNDFLHYELKPQFTEIYNRIIENGGSVSILCATGSELVAGGEYNGDVILPAEKVSGAFCAPFGMRFADGYSGIRKSCANPSHNHVSPSMQIDASSAYLPENTWFIDGQYHGQYYYEEYTRSLVEKLLFTDEIKDVYSNPDYPQFESSNNAYRNLHVEFDSSSSGYLCDDDSLLEVENLSDKNYINLLSITSKGVQLDFDLSGSGILEPGEKISVSFSGVIPKVGSKATQITVSYIEFGSANPFCVTDFDVMIDNGESDEGKEVFVAAEFDNDFKESIPESLYNILVKLSLRQFAECIYNLFS
ncbi:MAG: hypothetical protein IJE74_10515 [Clostridia bacterium]|nr:hypothetical protein [Clostridia bacterium]